MFNSLISGNILHKAIGSWMERIEPFRRLSTRRDAHWCSLPPGGIYTRFMRLAANPAPKPLCMLTTVTPAAQELSIPNKAANPLKLAP